MKTVKKVATFCRLWLILRLRRPNHRNPSRDKMVLHFSNKLHHLSKQSIYHTSQAGEQCNGSRQISQSSCEITRIIVLLQLPRLPRRAPEDDMFIKRGNVIECQPRTIATNCFDRLSIYIPVYLPL